MPQPDYLGIAKRLRAGRIFDGKRIKRTLPGMGDQYERHLARRYKNPKEFREVLEEILDNLKDRSFEDDLALELAYYNEIGKFAEFGVLYEAMKEITVN